MKKITSLLIWPLAGFGLYGTISLVVMELREGNICPKILSIPACYLILICFVLVLTSHSQLFKDKNWGYFIGAGIAFSIAIIGTIGQLTGMIECPKTTSGIPMCYLSLAFFSTLLLLKIVTIKLKQE